ncbi:hypothetical protein D9613_006539 [Agrocybe pediades]|uniref:Uncharacterized protein n=1 Tax=Agrocybe pediades TaxID=84607 RepID=A0A8H4QHZ6_9AGAR|nr:hypothetical protein D9613_006539 [Agrocybe pediades]
MSTVRRKSTSSEQKRRQKSANYPFSHRRTQWPDPAPRNLRLICDQIDAGNGVLQAQFQELSNAATAIMEGISALKAQLTRESRHFHVFRTLVASFLGKPLPVVAAETVKSTSTVRTRAFSEGNRIDTTYTSTKAKKRSSCANEENEVDNFPRKRRRLPSYVYQETYLKFRSQENISTDSGSTFDNPDCPRDPRLPSSSPISIPTNYSKRNRLASPQPRSPPPSRMMPHTDWFYTKYDFRRKHWIFVRDRRVTEKWKIIEEKQQKEVWRSYGTLQINLEQCCEDVDTTYGFQVDWEDYDVPYAGDDNILTPSHPNYPEHLRSKPPPERPQSV